MSGHSKWSTIKRKKGAKDAQRSKQFSKLIKEVTVAARLGGGDPDGNPRLRLALNKARAANMPADNLKRAVQKGTGELEGVQYEEVLYEAFGPGGVALLIETMTDNRNRTVGEVRHILDRHGGHLAQTGAVSHLFATSGYITVDATKVGEDTLMTAALESGAEDVRQDGEIFEVLTTPHDLETVCRGLEKAGIAFEGAEVARLPSTTVPVEGSKAGSMLKLMELLEDLDDVQKVYANFEISEADMAAAE
jgi:YebC/PmpR family DNA-binding regulatory protein